MMPLPPAGHPGADVADAAPSLLTQEEMSPQCLPRGRNSPSACSRVLGFPADEGHVGSPS